ncbi:peptidylprolyl isomerase [Marinilabiliaceae bacterium JC040]|nr:peptidylprolyl isomerase [Marinilabiliaceae bacterium JC040]
MKKLIAISLFSLFLIYGCGQKEKIVKIETPYGDMKIKLYNQTPKHRDNFLKLVNEKFYDGTIFHRVIKDFMIQGGDPDSKTADINAHLGEGGPGYDIDAEIVSGLFHKKGVLAAARESDSVNPKKKSSGSQFYIVQGNVYTKESLEKSVKRINDRRLSRFRSKYFLKHAKDFEATQKDGSKAIKALSDRLLKEVNELFKAKELKLSKEQIEAYTSVGGTPHLDGEYTVFGEVIEGLDVIDKIAEQVTNREDRPLKDIKIKITEVK